MSIVTVARTAGFCFGVKRAVEKVNEFADSGKQVYTLGPIIHNEKVVAGLALKGVKILEDVKAAEDTVLADCLKEKDSETDSENRKSVIVIRSHGVDRKTDERLRAVSEASKGKVEIFDATCPFVKKIHRTVAKASEEGKIVIVCGDPDHPEVKGITGWVSGQYFVVSSAKEIEDMVFSPENEYCLVAQTTFNIEKFTEILAIIEKIGYNSRTSVVNTICNATEERQTEARRLATESDAMIVVGGKHSSNTRKLYEISKEICPNTFFVEDASEIGKASFSEYGHIGITAGASTPHNIIEEVQNIMENFEQLLNENFKSIHNGEVVEGTVLDVKEDELVVNIGYKADGIVPRSEYSRDQSLDLTTVVKPGDTIKVKVLKVNDGDGQVALSYRKAQSAITESKLLEEAFNNKTTVTGKVSEVVKGGLSVLADGVRVFIPASLVSDLFEKDLSTYKNQDIEFYVSEYSPKERKVIGNRKQFIAEQKAAKLEAALSKLNEGDIFEGIVKNVTDFGAFVDIGDIDGLLHVSEMSWGRTISPKKQFKVGDKVKVFVKEIKGAKVALSKKFDEDNPWVQAEEKYAVGDIVTGKVARMAPFGAFVEIAPGIDALLHVSQISNERVEKPEDVLKVGQEIEAKIVEFKPENKKISISIRALLNAEKASDDAVAYSTEEAEAASEETKPEE